MQNGTVILKNSLTVCYKINHTLGTRSIHSNHENFPREMKTHVYIKICKNIHAIFIKKLAATKMSMN